MNADKLFNTSIAQSPIVVIEHFKVGPVKIEPNRLLMPYTVIQNGQADTKELIYKYEEQVFDKNNPTDQNLAGMIGAQLALNYGLFCEKITFDGLFDHTDQRFLKDMMENTSREILVNKILQPTVFLKEVAKGIVPQKNKRYTNAEVAFTNTAFPDSQLEWKYWENDRNKHCVLSSGGKDSLVSYGMLKEMGKDVHPIFGNESGRHWFTALNGYRYSKEIEPNTGRVWMNSDRLFAWMLRHLPFIRQDFATLRADDYPVRLWTVAVFLFGVIPVMKKRGISRLIIGDEYDSTQRGNFNGISHYNGLYDQSRFFDEALSRFYMKKGWAMSQFSLLRPLSEMLILKTLVKRYPHLQQHQTSCHATHEKDGRIYPCGKCEKCRRIIGMLTALDADPKHCGYTDAQIQSGLENLAANKIKQIGPDAAHLYYLLAQKGVNTKGKAHPEITNLRFDKERSHIEGIPLDLRAPLYSIMLAYAAGSVERINKKWEKIEVLENEKILAPYPFEHSEETLNSAVPPSQSNKYLWGELTWEEAEEHLKLVDIAILPVGAIEQHGPHLPLDVDAFDADYLAKKVAEACSFPKPLVMPLVPYGVSYHHQEFKGTISISNEAMAKFIYDIGMSLAKNGIKKLIIINGHGDNKPTLSYAAQMINRDAGIFVCIDTGETSDADMEHLISTKNDAHAGEFETSTTLANRPHLVKMDKAVDMTLEFNNKYLDFSSKNSLPWYVRTNKISENGTMGNPCLATADKGHKMWEIMIAHLVSLVESLKGISLDDIHQKRY